jgi:hypothetical protein
VDPAESGNGRLVGSLEGRFPWGLLVVSDEGSTEPIPPWETTDEPVASTAASLVVRVEHEQEGPATVHIYRGTGDLGGEPAFSGAVATPSGVLTVGDALRKQLIRVPGTGGAIRVRVLLNQPRQANHVDVVLD